MNKIPSITHVQKLFQKIFFHPSHGLGGKIIVRFMGKMLIFSSYKNHLLNKFTLIYVPKIPYLLDLFRVFVLYRTVFAPKYDVGFLSFTV